MPTDVERARQLQALRELNVAAYFGFDFKAALGDALLSSLFFPKQKVLVRPIVEELCRSSEPFSDFARGRLLGIIDGLYFGRKIRMPLYTMLEMEIQHRVGKRTADAPDSGNMLVDAQLAGYVISPSDRRSVVC